MSPKTKDQVEFIRKQSRSNIMKVALELFAHKGFHSTSVSQIAKTADVSKGLLYNYFESKEDLLLQIFMDMFRETSNILESELGKTDDPKVQLKNIIHQAFELVQSNLTFWKLATSLAFQEDVLSEYRESLKGYGKNMENQIYDIFKRLGYTDFKNEARLFSATLDGLGFQYMHSTEHYPIEELKEYLINKYCS